MSRDPEEKYRLERQLYNSAFMIFDSKMFRVDLHNVQNFHQKGVEKRQ